MRQQAAQRTHDETDTRLRAILRDVLGLKPAQVGMQVNPPMASPGTRAGRGLKPVVKFPSTPDAAHRPAHVPGAD